MGRVVNPLIVAVVAVVVYALFTNRLAQLQLICLTFSNNVQDASKAGRLQTEFPDLLRRFGRDLVPGSTESKGDMVDNPKAKRAYLSEFFTKIQKVDDDSTSSDGNIIPGTAWRTDRSPFSEALDRITGHANLGSGSGHANSTITRRADGRPVFTVGITNWQLDITFSMAGEKTVLRFPSEMPPLQPSSPNVSRLRFCAITLRTTVNETSGYVGKCLICTILDSALSNWIDAQGYGASGYFGGSLNTPIFADGFQILDDPEAIPSSTGTLFNLVYRVKNNLNS
jgi:hypothetical protein